jgi:hypothetical protein
LQIDEIRSKENLEPLGLDFIKLGLADVLYNPTTKEIYTPNTNAITKMGDKSEEDNPPPVIGESPVTGNNDVVSPSGKGGEKQDESGNQK